MKELEEIKLKVLTLFENDILKASKWIEWVHEGSKDAQTNEQKLTNIALASLSKHCAKCMNLGGCHFLKHNMPMLPLHPNCHCKIKPIEMPFPNVTAFAECPISKIKDYIFVDLAKKRFFESNGYDIMDSENMRANYEKQALEKYLQGDYTLGLLDEYGQRITIIIELPRRTSNNTQPLRVKSGWMVYPFGKIRLTTPATNLSAK